MQSILVWILAFSIICGQLIKVPISNLSGPIFLDISVLIISFIIIFLKLKDLKQIHLNLSIKLGLIFIIVSLFSLIFTPINLNFNQLLISFFYLTRFISYFAFGLLIHNYLNESEKINSIFILSGVTLALAGFIQFYFYPDLGFLQTNGWDPHFYRMVSTFLDPNFLGAFFVIVLSIIVFHLTRKQKYWLHFTFIFGVIFLSLLLTFSRSSYLMFFICFAAIAFLKKSIPLFILTIFLSLTLWLGFDIYTRSISKPRNIDRAQSAQLRLNNWQIGFKIFKEYPILGVGFNTYHYALVKNLNMDAQFLESRGSRSNDSSLLHILTTTGIIGLIIYLLFIFSIFKEALKSKTTQHNIILISCLLGLFAHSFFNNSLLYPPILFWIFVYSLRSSKQTVE